MAFLRIQLGTFRWKERGKLTKVSTPTTFPAVSLYHDGASTIWAANVFHTYPPFSYTYIVAVTTFHIKGVASIKIYKNALLDSIIPDILRTRTSLNVEILRRLKGI